MRILSALVLSLTLIQSFAQEWSDSKKLIISIQPLAYMNFESYLVDPKPGAGMNFSFEYRINSKWTLATNFLYGKFSSYNTLWGYVPLAWYNEQNTSLDHTNLHYSFIAQRSIRLHKDVHLKIGTGIGTYSEKRTGYTPTYKDGEMTGFGLESEVYADAAFPLFISFEKQIHESWVVGFRGGLFFAPFYSVFGWNIGPTIGLKL